MNQKITQLYNATPEDLVAAFQKVLDVKFEALVKNFQPKEPTRYLTRKEVKDLLKVDMSTVHNWTVKGKLKAYGIGNRIFYKRHEVEQAVRPLK